ncbi:MAG: helix-turn-helix domain-containing protein [Flavobacteriales bacterium]
MSIPPRPKCPSCNSSRTIKNGLRDGFQRYKCKDCSYRYTSKTRKRKLDKHIVVSCLQLWLEGLSRKAIADIVGVDRNAVSNWLKPYQKALKDIRIDRSKEQFEIVKKSKVYFVEDERVRTSGVLFIGKEKEVWGVKRLGKAEGHG